MSFQLYSNLTNPNDVLAVISSYVASRGYTVVADCVDDLNIYDQSSSDGKKLVFRSRNMNYFYILRSANGVNIFGTIDELAMSSANKQEDVCINGIGVIVSDGYSPVARWYNQGGVPLTYKGEDVLGGFMPVANIDDNNSPTNFIYSLYCNNVTSQNADTLVFTIMKERDSFRQCAHIIIGELMPYGEWTGGAFFSASATRDMINTAWECFTHKMDADKFILPVLCSGGKSNTFLRMDIDAAPTASRGFILWASSGADNLTGKRLSLPIRLEAQPDADPGWSTNGRIPNYSLLQSTDMFDWGRNINTLNCLTINLPIYFAVQVDPDGLNVYASAGQVLGVYFVCMLNMQTSGTYKLNYPSNIDICQVFPMGKRRGVYGFDGISIKQEGDQNEPIVYHNYANIGAWPYPATSVWYDIDNSTTGIRAYTASKNFSGLTYVKEDGVTINFNNYEDGQITYIGNSTSDGEYLCDEYTFYYTDPQGDNLYFDTWTPAQLNSIVGGENLFKSSPDLKWIIRENTGGKLFTTGETYGGIVGIVGKIDLIKHPEYPPSGYWPIESSIPVTLGS